MINLALIGAGRIGQIHAQNIMAHSRATLVAVVDTHLEAAVNLAHKCNARVDSLDAVLTDPNIHAIVIASSTATHLNIISQAAQQKKAIFCEKPIDLSFLRVWQCLSILKKHPVTFMVGFNRRFDKHFMRLRDLLIKGEIGNLEMLSITSRDPMPPPLAYIPQSGGLFHDMMIHDFDMAAWLLDEEITEVMATGSVHVEPRLKALNDIDTAMVILKTASGRLCHINNSRRAIYGYDQRIEAFGEAGMLQVENPTQDRVKRVDGKGLHESQIHHFFLTRYQQAYRSEIAHFIDCVASRKTPRITQQDGYQALLLAEAAKLSYHEGKLVKIAELEERLKLSAARQQADQHDFLMV